MAHLTDRGIAPFRPQTGKSGHANSCLERTEATLLTLVVRKRLVGVNERGPAPGELCLSRRSSRYE